MRVWSAGIAKNSERVVGVAPTKIAGSRWGGSTRQAGRRQDPLIVSAHRGRDNLRAYRIIRLEPFTELIQGT